MAYARQRKYPRVPYRQPAQIEFLDRKKGQRVHRAVSVHTVACEGVGLTVDPSITLRRRTRVNVCLTIDGEALSLPGAVAWTTPEDLGVRLLLELALPDTRRRWAHWIVEKTSAHKNAERPLARKRTSRR